MIRRSTTTRALVLGALVLTAACGAAATEPAAGAASTTVAPTTTANDDGTNDEPSTESSVGTPATTSPAGDQGNVDGADADQPAPTEPPAATDAATTTTDATTTTTTEPADEPQGMAWPDDGCSTDGSPTQVSAADGPAPELELRPESASSPLPPIAVRRINCNGGWVNFQNELPADRPLLVWFWAPH